MNTHTTQLRSFILGAMLSILILIPIVTIMEQPMYEAPTGDSTHGWDFSTGLTLSSGLYQRRAELVSFSVSYSEIIGYDNGIGISQPVSYFVRGASGFGGRIIPQHIPITYFLNQTLVDFDLQVHYSSKSIWGDAEPISISSEHEKLGAISQGLFTVLNADEDIKAIEGQDQYNQQYQDLLVENAQVLTISHLYTDGTDIRITIAGDIVLVNYDLRDYIEFAEDSTCICDLPEHMGQDRQEYYLAEYDNLDLTPYVYSINDAILSLF